MSELKLYNSLTRQMEILKPLKRGHVGLYTCGPTVYDHVHIGNLRTYIFEDTLRRVLRLSGLKVKHVMNITDIEDKIFARARDQNVDYTKLTRQYEKIFFQDATTLNIDLEGSTIIRATEAIADMQELIRHIPNKYVAEDGVYFDIAKYADYGVFEKLDRSHEHHRINNDEYDKDHAADFALWKTQKPGEPSWDFELEGQSVAGRPGWHIECSAMSTKHLGQPFDIHTGGVDLKFPHHENEIAQSKAATGKELSRVFLHAEHLLVEGKKMSKSLQNFYTLEDIVAKGFDPLAFRLLVLQAHYRSQLNFTWESLEGARTFLASLRRLADLVLQPQETGDAFSAQTAQKTRTAMLLALQNDLGTASVLGDLAQLDLLRAVNKKDVDNLLRFLEFVDDALGLGLAKRDDITKAQKTVVTEREAARAKNDWGKADELRQQLLKDNIELKDTDHGPVWSRV